MFLNDLLITLEPLMGAFDLFLCRWIGNLYDLGFTLWWLVVSANSMETGIAGSVCLRCELGRSIGCTITVWFVFCNIKKPE